MNTSDEISQIINELKTRTIERDEDFVRMVGEEMFSQIHPHFPAEYAFQESTPDDLEKLRELGLPECIVDFYGYSEPLSVDGPVRVCSVSGIVAENSEAVPGCFVSKLGYVVFATTHCGDTLCYDLNSPDGEEPRIVHISHGKDYSGMTAEEVLSRNEVVCDGLLDFWTAFASGDPDRKLDPVARG